MNLETKFYLELSPAGVTGVKIIADNAEETAEAHELLKSVAIEIRMLDAALKTALAVDAETETDSDPVPSIEPTTQLVKEK